MISAQTKTPVPERKVLMWAVVAALGVASLCINRPKYGPNGSEYYPASLTVLGTGFEAFALAESLVNQHTFSDPFLPLPTGPSAHMAPLYPAFLALIITLFGQGRAAVEVLSWCVSLMLALQTMLLPILARHLRLGFWTGVLASFAWIGAGTAPTVASEATMAGMLVLMAAYFMQSSFVGVLSWTSVLASSLVWGALLLMQPVVILILFAWLMLLGFVSRCSTAQKMSLGFLPILVMSPWIVRNYVVFHKPVFVRDNLGLELAVSNNACATYSFQINLRNGCYSVVHPNVSYDEAARVREVGEVGYNQARLRETKEWIRENPTRFCVLTVQRIQEFWFPSASSDPAVGMLLRPWIVDVFTLLCVAGLFFMWRNVRVGVYVVAPWLLIYPLTYYLMQCSVRFRFPILWASLLPGSYFIVEVTRNFVGFKENKAELSQ